MATDVIVPVPDQTTQEVRIVSWKKQVGDAVEKSDILMEIETDKSIMEVEAIDSGILLQQLVEEDDMVPVGQKVGLIGQVGEKIEEANSSAADVKASPVAKRLAEKLGVDLSQIKGSGPQGRITKEDVEKASGSTPASASKSAASVEDLGLIEVIVPVPDQTTQEVRIVSWNKQVGDAVAKGDVVMEIETDKSIMEVEAIGSGVLLKQLVEEDDMVPVSQLVGYIGKAGTDVSSLGGSGSAPQSVQKKATPAVAPATPAAVQSAPVTRSAATVGGRLIASPNAKRLANELGVDLQQLAGTGTGAGGRIVGKDVTAYAASSPAGAAVARPVTIAELTTPANGQPQPGTAVELTKMRRAIGGNLQMSSRDTPHFNVAMSVEMTRAMDVRSQLNAGKSKDQKISVNDLVVRACAFALRQFPSVNSRLSTDKIEYLPDVNIGIAIALDTGLVVPVVTNVDQLSWSELGQQTKEIARQARNGKMLNYGKGSFTISNLGMFGVDEFTAIINPPESAILAVGGIKNEVVDIGGGIGLRSMMKVTLCSDHRVIDGAQAAQFLQSIKRYLEEQIS